MFGAYTLHTFDLGPCEYIAFFFIFLRKWKERKGREERRKNRKRRIEERKERKKGNKEEKARCCLGYGDPEVAAPQA